MNKNHLDEKSSIVMSLLFTWGDPLSTEDISTVLSISKKETERILQLLHDFLESSNLGLLLKRYGKSYQLVTCQENHTYIEKLFNTDSKQRILSTSSMETLALIAYRQPITKLEIDQVRGVKSNSSIETLLNKGLIRNLGRADKIGRPILYGTTELFLKHFDLSDISELPPIDTNRELGNAVENQ